MNRRGIFTGWMTFVAACLIAVAGALGGRVLCLCSEDPDGCGRPCHVCGEGPHDGLHAADDCTHVPVLVADLQVASTAVSPAEDVVFPVAAVCPVVEVRRPATPRPFRSTAPPEGRNDLALFLARSVHLLA